jgi:hypothetical protein
MQPLLDSITTPYYKYNDTLCLELWNHPTPDTYALKPEIRSHLMEIFNSYKDFVGATEQLNDVAFLEDIVITGSSTNYNWTTHSDIDLHLILNYDALYSKQFKIILATMLKAKTQLWNATREIKIKGFNVELYPQDKKEAHYAAGIYSIKNNQWVKEPEFKPPLVSDTSVKAKYLQYKHSIEVLVKGNCSVPSQAVRLQKRIIKMRKAGLAKGGEFSVENLVFKKLRNMHLIDKLQKCYIKYQDAKLSID